MKKLLLTAALGGLFAATAVQAQTSIYICGSTAFRSNAYRAIKAMFDGGAPTSENEGSPVPSNPSGAGKMTFQGNITPLFGANTVTIYCSWTGSAQGTHSLTANPGDQLSFLTLATPDNGTFTHTADLAFSDVFQATTGFTSPTLTDEQVAVQPFCWVKGSGSDARITNIAMQQLDYAIIGSCPLTYLIGTTNAADYNTTVYFTGRNKDSGSRLVSLSDCKYKGSVNIYSNTGTGSPILYTVSQIVNGVNYGPGFASGGTEAGNIALGGYNNVGYLGYADARTVVAAGGQILTYNGLLPFTGGSTTTTNGMDVPNFAPVTSGQYSMWGPEHLFINPNNTGNFAAAFAVYTNIVPYINTDVTNTANGFITAIQIGAMGNTTRTSDGGAIAP